MKENKKNIGLYILIGIVVLSFTGVMNKTFMGALMQDPVTGQPVAYQYESICSDSQKVEGKCPVKFISCTKNSDCQKACIGSTSYKFVAEQFNVTENEIYTDISSSFCDSTNHCVVSEYCVSSGAVKEWILQNPWAWVQHNPVLAVGIGAAIVLFLFI